MYESDRPSHKWLENAVVFHVKGLTLHLPEFCHKLGNIRSECDIIEDDQYYDRRVIALDMLLEWKFEQLAMESRLHFIIDGK